MWKPPIYETFLTVCLCVCVCVYDSKWIEKTLWIDDNFVWKRDLFNKKSKITNHLFSEHTHTNSMRNPLWTQVCTKIFWFYLWKRKEKCFTITIFHHHLFVLEKVFFVSVCLSCTYGFISARTCGCYIKRKRVHIKFFPRICVCTF